VIPRPVKDTRGHLRVDVSLETSICSSAVRRVSAELVDISATGCRVATPIYLIDDCHLSVTIPGFSPFGAKVRWCRNSALGLEFTRPLHPSVVDHVARMGKRVSA
jgi:hypothetical protein